MNVLRLSLHPDGLGSRVVDLPAFSAHVLGRLRRQAALTGDAALAALHRELRALPGVATEESWDASGVVLPLTVRTAVGELSFFTTATVFGAAADVTLDELTVELFYPADDATDRAVRAAVRAAEPSSGSLTPP